MRCSNVCTSLFAPAEELHWNEEAALFDTISTDVGGIKNTVGRNQALRNDEGYFRLSSDIAKTKEIKAATISKFIH